MSLSSLATAEIRTSAVERKAPREFGSVIHEHMFRRVLSQSSNADNEASSLDLNVFSPRIKTLRTTTEFVQRSIDLRQTGVERYSLEVNPPTVSGVFNSFLGVDRAK
jgi:phage baseplate assembly protein W